MTSFSVISKPAGTGGSYHWLSRVEACFCVLFLSLIAQIGLCLGDCPDDQVYHEHTPLKSHYHQHKVSHCCKPVANCEGLKHGIRLCEKPGGQDVCERCASGTTTGVLLKHSTVAVDQDAMCFYREERHGQCALGDMAVAAELSSISSCLIPCRCRLEDGYYGRDPCVCSLSEMCKSGFYLGYRDEEDEEASCLRCITEEGYYKDVEGYGACRLDLNVWKAYFTNRDLRFTKNNVLQIKSRPYNRIMLMRKIRREIRNRLADKSKIIQNEGIQNHMVKSDHPYPVDHHLQILIKPIFTSIPYDSLRCIVFVEGETNYTDKSKKSAFGTIPRFYMNNAGKTDGGPIIPVSSLENYIYGLQSGSDREPGNEEHEYEGLISLNGNVTAFDSAYQESLFKFPRVIDMAISLDNLGTAKKGFKKLRDILDSQLASSGCGSEPFQWVERWGLGRAKISTNLIIP